MKKHAFSLLEIMIALVIISVILACMTPLLTKKKHTTSSTNLSSDLPVGTIVMYLGQTPPEGWLLCNGSTFSASAYPELKQHLGDNKTPDLRGYVPRGATDEDIEKKNKGK